MSRPLSRTQTQRGATTAAKINKEQWERAAAFAAPAPITNAIKATVLASHYSLKMDCEEISECPVFAEEEIGDYADDATWILTASFVILTMQSGFGLLEIGNIMPGNEVNVMLKNVVDVLYGSLAFYFLGYGIACK
jgi:hypothetical protein